MRWKKIPINIIRKADEEIDSYVNKLKFRNYAQTYDELKEHIFLAEMFLIKYSKTPHVIVKMAIEYLKDRNEAIKQ